MEMREAVHKSTASERVTQSLRAGNTFDPTPHVPAFPWQIGTLETAVYTKKDSSPEQFERFKNYLLDYYPADHTVQLCQTSVYPMTESQQIEVELGEFESIHDQVNGVQTLYVPPVGEKEIQDEELQGLIESSDHLETITEPAEE